MTVNLNLIVMRFDIFKVPILYEFRKSNLRQKKKRSEAFLYFFYAVKDVKKVPGITMTERGRSVRSLGCDVRGLTCCLL